MTLRCAFGAPSGAASRITVAGVRSSSGYIFGRTLPGAWSARWLLRSFHEPSRYRRLRLQGLLRAGRPGDRKQEGPSSPASPISPRPVDKGALRSGSSELQRNQRQTPLTVGSAICVSTLVLGRSLSTRGHPPRAATLADGGGEGECDHFGYARLAENPPARKIRQASAPR